MHKRTSRSLLNHGPDSGSGSGSGSDFGEMSYGWCGPSAFDEPTPAWGWCGPPPHLASAFETMYGDGWMDETFGDSSSYSDNMLVNWGFPAVDESYGECYLGLSWEDLIALKNPADPSYDPSSFVTGGLGRLTTDRDGQYGPGKFEVWICVRDNDCSYPSGLDAAWPMGDPMCYVYDEEDNAFYPWARNSSLGLATPSWYGDELKAAAPFDGKSCPVWRAWAEAECPQVLPTDDTLRKKSRKAPSISAAENFEFREHEDGAGSDCPEPTEPEYSTLCNEYFTDLSCYNSILGADLESSWREVGLGSRV